MATRRKQCVTVYLEPEQLERLRALSKQTRIPLAVYQREGIELVLAKHASPPPKETSE